MIRVHRLEGAAWRTDEGVDAARAARAAAPERCAWIEIVAPDAAERELLEDGFGVHELAMEDALEPQHPPILREFDDHLFAIVHAPESADRRETRKVALALGAGWIVSLARAPIPMLDPLLHQMRRNPAWYLDAPELVLHAIVGHMAEIFEARVDELIDHAERLEEIALERPSPDVLKRLHQLQRRAASFTRIVRAQRDVCQALARGGSALLSRTAEPYLRDAADHMVRIYDLLEAVRDGILAAREGYLTAVSNQLNRSMRTLTALATVLLPLALIAGIFGMNFDSMPLLRARAGFWIVIGAMAACGAGMWLWMRRRRWL